MPFKESHNYFDKDEGSGENTEPAADDFDETGVKKFETIAKPYSELGQEKHGLNIWGDIKITRRSYLYGGPPTEFGPIGSYLNLYTSPEIIKRGFTNEIIYYGRKMASRGESPEDLVVADVGGYDGFLLNTVMRQLEESGINASTGINIEADPKGEALPAMQKKVESGEYSAKLRAVKANILENVPVEPESVDFVISRCAIQYSTKEQHIQFLKNIAKMLKEDGQLILQFPGILEDPEGTYTEIQREISKIVTKGIEFKRDFPDSSIVSKFGGGYVRNTELRDYSFVTELINKIDMQLEVGLSSHGYDKIDWLMSPESWGDRFNLDSEQIEEIRQLYVRFQATYPDLFEEEDGILCLRTQLVRGMFHKTNKREREADTQVQNQLKGMLPNDQEN